MKIPLFTTLSNPTLLAAATKLPKTGKLLLSKNYLTYLDVDNRYILELFPLLKIDHIQQPDYFGHNSAGAHISVVYPEEHKKIQKKDLNQEHHFEVTDLISAELFHKTYYALLVNAPSLVALRKKYGLPEALNFKGYAIDFHITVAVSKN